MLITNKPLKASDPTKLCLVISLDNGIKVQYPVDNTAEAIARYTDFLQTNSLSESSNSQDIAVANNTCSKFN